MTKKQPLTIKIDELIRTKRKTIALMIDRDGRLVVRAPLRATNRQIMELVEEKAAWIRKKQEEAKASYSKVLPKEYVNGEGFEFLGKSYRLRIVETARPALTLAEGEFRLSRQALPRAEAVFTAWYREQARELLSLRVTWYAELFGLKVTGLRINSARTRWGSCNAQGSLNFTWRLVMAPLSVVDYVVVHELVHTRFRNHRREFWMAVKEILPDYKQRMNWLKINGHLLTIY